MSIQAEVELLYIVSLPYSGSTLLAALMGNSDNFFNAGEINFIENDYHEDKSCLCQKLVKDCSFWGQIIKELEKANKEGAKVLEFSNDRNLRPVDKRKHKFSSQLSIALGRKVDSLYSYEELSDYSERHEDFIKRMSRVSGAKFIIDSSKTERRLQTLVGHGKVPIKIIYLIKDFKEAFQSRINRARKRNPWYIPIFSIYYGAVMLSQIRIMSNTVRKHQDGSISISFSELCENPHLVEERLSNWLGYEQNFRLDENMKFEMRDQHAFTGNIWMVRNAAKTSMVVVKPSISPSTLTTFEKIVASAFSHFLPREYSKS